MVDVLALEVVGRGIRVRFCDILFETIMDTQSNMSWSMEDETIDNLVGNLGGARAELLLYYYSMSWNK